MHISPHGVFAGGRIRSGNPQAHDAGRLQPGAFGFVFHVVQINLGFSIPNLPRPLGANVSAREYFWQSLRVPSSASLDDQLPNYSVDSGDSQRILLMGVRCNASRADPARLDACAAVLLGGERRPADTRIATHYPICDRAMPVACNSSAVAWPRIASFRRSRVTERKARVGPATAAWLTSPHREAEQMRDPAATPLKFEAYSIQIAAELGSVLKYWGQP